MKLREIAYEVVEDGIDYAEQTAEYAETLDILIEGVLMFILTLPITLLTIILRLKRLTTR